MGNYDGSIRVNAALGGDFARLGDGLADMAALGTVLGEYMDRFAEERVQPGLFPSASSYAMQTAGSVSRQTFEFPIYVGGEHTGTVKTDAETALRPDWHDPMIDNGGGR